MPISSTTRKVGPLFGNGVSDTFAFDFKIFEASELRVVQHHGALGLGRDLVPGSDYNVALNPGQDESPGGTVVLTRPLPVGDRLVLLSNVPYIQPVDLTNQGGFYPDLVNGGLDRSVIQTQQLLEKMGRAILVPVTAEEGTFELPLPQGNQLLMWGPDGKSITNVDPRTLVSVAAYGSTRADKFFGDGVSTVFPLSGSPGSVNNLTVAIGGVLQVPEDDYVWSGGTLIVFAVPPPSGVRVLVRFQEALSEGTDISSKADRNGGNLSLADAEAFRDKLSVGRNKGAWDAETNSPMLSPGVGAEGDFYHVSAHGLTELDGVSTWNVGDVVRFEDGKWSKDVPFYQSDFAGTVPRPAYLRMQDRISIRDWVPPQDSEGQDNTAKFQQALDEMKAAGRGKLHIDPPLQKYVISDTLVYRSQAPLEMCGGAPQSGTPTYTNRQAALTFTGAHNKHCLLIETDGNSVATPLRGVHLSGVMVRRENGDFALKGSGGAGIALRGVVGFTVRDCSSYGFDDGVLLDDNPTNAGSNSIRCFAGSVDNLEVMQAGSHRVHHRGAGEIVYTRPVLRSQGRAGYFADMAIVLGTNGGGPDHNHIYGGALIGGSNQPQHNLYVAAGFFNKAFNTSFERASVSGVYITTNGGVSDRDHFSLVDCWWDGMPGYCLDTLGVRVNVHNPRMQQVLASENGGVAPTVPAARHRGQTAPGTPIVGGAYTGGGVIYFTGPSGIEVDNMARMNLFPPLIVDRTGSTKPSIVLGDNTTRCSVMFPQIGASTGEPVLGGTNHTYVGESGVMMGGGEITRLGGPKSAVMDASGVASVAHGTTLAKIVAAEAFMVNSGSRVPVPVQFVDGTNIQVSTSAADAGKTVWFTWTRTK